MDLWKLFLTPRQEQKLNLLEEIISKKEVSLDELAFYNDTLCSKQLTSLYYDIFIIEEQSLPLEYYAEKLAEQFLKKIKL